jgi:hypothetical protein
MSKSMDFPGQSKKYSDTVNQEYKLDQPLSYIAVPGPQGERGPKGDTGPVGPEGIQGPKGDAGKPGKDGKDGKNGKDGKPGESSISPSGQRLGWALYKNLKVSPIQLGATKGNDGWVRIKVDSEESGGYEEYLPENNVSLYNPATQKINLRGLKIGSIITICYDVTITTFSNNTEVWFRTLIEELGIGPTTFVANLKYQFPYDLSLEHTVFLENEKMKNAGIFSEILTDNECSMIVKNLYISVR